MIQPNGGGGVNQNVRDLFFSCGEEVAALSLLLSSSRRRPGPSGAEGDLFMQGARDRVALSRAAGSRGSLRAPGMTKAKECNPAPDKHARPDPRRCPFTPGSGSNPPPGTAANPPSPTPAYNAARGGQRAAPPCWSLTSPPSNPARPPRAEADCQHIDAAPARASDVLNYFPRGRRLSAPSARRGRSERSARCARCALCFSVPAPPVLRPPP
jgi:hypothetical protein